MWPFKTKNGYRGGSCYGKNCNSGDGTNGEDALSGSDGINLDVKITDYKHKKTGQPLQKIETFYDGVSLRSIASVNAPVIIYSKGGHSGVAGSGGSGGPCSNTNTMNYDGVGGNAGDGGAGGNGGKGGNVNVTYDPKVNISNMIITAPGGEGYYGGQGGQASTDCGTKGKNGKRGAKGLNGADGTKTIKKAAVTLSW